MQRVYDEGVRAAATEANILIVGEDGVGKKALAGWLHATSPRAAEPLVAINCAADALCYEDDGTYDRRLGPGGAFRKAHGGVLVINEIGDLKIESVRKLRAVLETRSARLANAHEPIPADVQLFALTCRDFRAEIDAGTRSPEYLVIADVTLQVPPLRQRRPEIQSLAEHFVAAQCARDARPPQAISPAVMSILEARDWPQNILELRWVMQEASALCRGPEIGQDDLPTRILRG
jgi:DNA-binding NtrC family response regulator